MDQEQPSPEELQALTEDLRAKNEAIMAEITRAGASLGANPMMLRVETLAEFVLSAEGMAQLNFVFSQRLNKMLEEAVVEVRRTVLTQGVGLPKTAVKLTGH